MIHIAKDIPAEVHWKEAVHLPTAVFFCQMSEPFAVLTPIGMMTGQAGAYLMRIPDSGKMYVCEEADFKTCFDPVSAKH